MVTVQAVYPGQAAKLLSYQDHILAASLRYNFDGVLLYDKHFRQLAEKDLSLWWIVGSRVFRSVSLISISGFFMPQHPYQRPWHLSIFQTEHEQRFSHHSD